MADKTNKLNICLIKAELSRPEDIIEPSADAHVIEGLGTFYTEASHPRMPSWIANFFGNTLPDVRLITSTAKGVLLVDILIGDKITWFAVIFGYGRSLLNEGVIEERFGLKVVLNSVDHESLRSIHKTTLGSVPKQSREQMSRDGIAANFGIDIEQDLINEITGRSGKIELGKTISGRDLLSVAVKIDINGIREFLQVCLAQYLSNSYKAQFSWIDQIKELRDPMRINNLNDELCRRLKARLLEKVWMAVPEVVDWVDVKGFRYMRPATADLKSDLDLTEFLESIQDRELTVDLLKSIRIYVISAKTDEAYDHWTAYKCLYSEIEFADKMHVLNNGKWYEIAPDFATAVHDDYIDIPETTINFPDCLQNDEGEYNDALPNAIPNSHCMDRKLITYGGGHSSIEFCDLATEDKKLIHIKRYGGSSQLSHLFSQGVVSAELFVEDEKFREALNEKLPTTLRLDDSKVRPIASDYEVVFAIISKSINPLEIPFFSKVS